MSSGTGRTRMRSAAWRISLWATLAFAIGTMAVFMFLHQFVSTDIQRRSDAWLSGEVEVLSDVANHTPQDALYGRVLGEVAELASREVPNRPRSSDGVNDSVFFLQTAADGSLALWVGDGNGSAEWLAIQGSRIAPDTPFNLHVRDREIPFRVVAVRMDNGGSIYLGLSERDELRVLKNLRLRFFLLWLLIVLLGFAIVFYSTRRMLGDVREITEAASRIGESDLSKRVPASRRHDEVAQLASTLNHMLDRIESSIHQLHTITDSLAAIRGKLEMLLSGDIPSEQADSIVTAIEEVDRLCDFLDSSLDVAEAKADALRLSRTTLDLDELLRVMIDLYEPSMAEKGFQVRLRSAGPLRISADASLIHRMVSNLLDNELNHLPAGSTISVALGSDSGDAALVIEDDGPGFSKDIGERLFEQGIRGKDSRGHGLGLAFVRAVVRAHGGSVSAVNRSEGGARLSITLPLIVEENKAERLPTLI